MKKKIDHLGRVVIPAEIRKALNMKDGAEYTITLKGRQIIIEPCEAVCAICGGAATIKIGESKSLCKSCADTIRKKA